MTADSLTDTATDETHELYHFIIDFPDMPIVTNQAVDIQVDLFSPPSWWRRCLIWLATR